VCILNKVQFGIKTGKIKLIINSLLKGSGLKTQNKMKFNKQLIYTIAILFSFAFISCNDDVEQNGNGNGNENGVRKLPSRITISHLDYPDYSETWTFKYDNQNRLIEFGIDNWTYKIEYDENSRVSRMTYGDGVVSFEHTGNNQIVMTSDYEVIHLTLDNNGQLIRVEDFENEWWLTFTYTNGNLTSHYAGGQEFSFAYSEGTLNVSRYAVNPDWLLLLFDNFFVFYPPSQYMPSKVISEDGGWIGEFAFTHETDADGFVTSSIVTISWDERDWDNYENYSLNRRSKSNVFGNSQLLRSQTRASKNSETFIITYEYILAQ